MTKFDTRRHCGSVSERRSACGVAAAVLFTGLSLGCAGSKPEAESANAEPEPMSDSEPLAMQEPETSEPPPEETSSTVTPEDFKNALQVVIQDSALQKELKLEEPGRFPLKISGADIPMSIELVAATEAVEVVAAPENPKEEAVLVFTEIKFSGDEGVFKYRYDVEGVRGTSYVVRGPAGWELKSSRVSGY